MDGPDPAIEVGQHNYVEICGVQDGHPREVYRWQAIDGPQIEEEEDVVDVVVEVRLPGPQVEQDPNGVEFPGPREGGLQDPHGDADVDEEVAAGPPPQRREMSLAVRGEIIGRFAAGETQEHVAQTLGVCVGTVRKWVNRNIAENGNLANRPRSGRQRKTTPEEDDAIVNTARENPITRDGSAGIAQRVDVDISPSTVQRRLHEAGLFHFRPSRKPGLNDYHREMRVAFANAHGEEELEYYYSMIFADEKTFTSNTDGKLVLWRPKNARYQKEYVLPKYASGHVALGYWGCMSGWGPGPLVATGPRLNGQRYCHILEENLLPYAANLYGEGKEFIYVEDNAPWHKNRHTLWWKQNRPFIINAPLPPCGSELNPMETVWAEAVDTWTNRNERTAAALDAHVRQQWQLLSQRPQFFSRLTEGYAERLRAVILSEGYSIGW